MAGKMAGDALPRKPPEGERCNGCGLCCALELCSLATEFLGVQAAPCPAMEFAGGRIWCGVARSPHRYLGTPPSSDRVIGPIVRETLSIGTGCDCGEKSLPDQATD